MKLLSRSPRERTVPHVIPNDRRADTAAMLTGAHRLLDGTPADCNRHTSRRRRPAARLDDTLLAAARLVLTSLEVLGRLDRPAVVRERIVRAAFADAHACAPRGAIGVTCVLADMLRRPDERELAMTLERARGAFSRRELIDGAAAMCGAASHQVAERLGVDAIDVIDELAARGRPRRSTRREHCRRRHS